jgi:hypothetical protein
MLCGSDECKVCSAGNRLDKDDVSSRGSKIGNDDGNNVEEKDPKESVQKGIMTFFKRSQRSVAKIVLQKETTTPPLPAKKQQVEEAGKPAQKQNMAVA